MTLDEFHNQLSDLLARSMDLSKEEVLSELEMQADCLRDDIARDDRAVREA